MRVDSNKVVTLLESIETNIDKFPWKRYDYWHECPQAKYEMECEPTTGEAHHFSMWYRETGGGWFSKPKFECRIEFWTFNRASNSHEDSFELHSDDMSPQILERLRAFQLNVEAAVVRQREAAEREEAKAVEDSLLRLAEKLK